MSKRTLGKVEVLARVKTGDLRVVDAAALLRVSCQKAERLWKRYRQEGAAWMKHRGGGRRSNRAYAESLRRKVLRRVQEKYGGEVGERFGPTLAAESLASENGLQVDAETLRRWMLGEGLWSRERRRRRHHRPQERKQHFGELVQMDGSFHRWLEERGPGGCLMDLVDNATSTTAATGGWAAAPTSASTVVGLGLLSGSLALWPPDQSPWLRAGSLPNAGRGPRYSMFKLSSRLSQTTSRLFAGAYSDRAKPLLSHSSRPANL